MTAHEELLAYTERMAGAPFWYDSVKEEYYERLVHHLVAVVQEQEQRIATLEARLP